MALTIDLQGRRALVVGGSAGIGRATALSLAAAGADFAVVGRSEEKLADVLVRAGRGTSIVADVRDPAQCVGLVEDAVAALGGFDVVLFASGIAKVQPIGRLDHGVLQDLFTTNALGPAMIADAAVRHLTADGLVLFLSSVAATADYQGNGPYAASKAALDRLVQAFRLEHPTHRFACVSVGDTGGTDISRSHDHELIMELLPKWLASAAMYEQMMDAEDLGQALAELVALLLAHPGITMPNLTVVPPGPKRTGTLEEFLASRATAG